MPALRFQRRGTPEILVRSARHPQPAARKTHATVRMHRDHSSLVSCARSEVLRGQRRPLATQRCGFADKHINALADMTVASHVELRLEMSKLLRTSSSLLEQLTEVARLVSNAPTGSASSCSRRTELADTPSSGIAQSPCDGLTLEPGRTVSMLNVACTQHGGNEFSRPAPKGMSRTSSAAPSAPHHISRSASSSERAAATQCCRARSVELEAADVAPSPAQQSSITCAPDSSLPTHTATATCSCVHLMPRGAGRTDEIVADAFRITRCTPAPLTRERAHGDSCKAGARIDVARHAADRRSCASDALEQPAQPTPYPLGPDMITQLEHSLVRRNIGRLCACRARAEWQYRVCAALGHLLRQNA